MKIKFVVNNYQLGTKIKSTPVDKIVLQNRLDKHHTEVIYDELTENEKNFCEKVLSRRGVIVDESIWRKS